MSEVLDHSYDEDELVPTDERQSEISGSVHYVWIVQVSFRGGQYTPSMFCNECRSPIYSRIFEIGWEILDEEIAEKPSYITAPTSADK